MKGHARDYPIKNKKKKGPDPIRPLPCRKPEIIEWNFIVGPSIFFFFGGVGVLHLLIFEPFKINFI